MHEFAFGSKERTEISKYLEMPSKKDTKRDLPIPTGIGNK